MGQRLKAPTTSRFVRPDASTPRRKEHACPQNTSHRPRSCSARPPAGSARPTPASTPTSAPASPSCSPVGARSSPTTWASARPGRRSSRCARPRRTARSSSICPAGVKLDWRREIGLVEPEADVQVVAGQGRVSTEGRRWTVVNYDLLGRFEDRFAGVEWGGVVVDEAHYIKNGSRRAAQVLRLVGAHGERRSRGRLPADRHADDEPAARPLQPAAAVRHPLATQLLQLRQALLRGRRQRLRPRHARRLERRGAREDRLRRDAPPRQDRGARPAAEDAHLAAGRGGRRSGSGSRRRGRSRSTRRIPSAAGRPGRRSSACSHRRATPRRGQGAAHARGRPRAGRSRREGGRVHVVHRTSIEKLKAELGDDCRRDHGEDDPEAARGSAAAAFQNDDRRACPARQPPRRRRRDQPHRRHPRRLQRPRLGARQPLAGRGPHLPDRPDSARRSSPTSSPRARSTTSSPRCSSRRRARSACSRTRPPTALRSSTRSSSPPSAARRPRAPAPRRRAGQRQRRPARRRARPVRPRQPRDRRRRAGRAGHHGDVEQRPRARSTRCASAAAWRRVLAPASTTEEIAATAARRSKRSQKLREGQRGDVTQRCCVHHRDGWRAPQRLLAQAGAALRYRSASRSPSTSDRRAERNRRGCSCTARPPGS